MLATLTACSKEGMSSVASDVGKFIEADGRSYGKTYTAKMNELQQNSFFSQKVTDAIRLKDLGNYTANEGWDFLAVEVSVTNTFKEDIPMTLYDFTVRWGEGEEDFEQAFPMEEGEENGYGFTDYGEDFVLSPAKSFKGWCYFMVPFDADNILFEYVELYEDDFDGNTYQVELGNPAYR